MSLLRRFKKPPSQPPPKKEVLRARPVRNPAVTWGPDKKGDMVIYVPLQAKPWMTRFKRLIPSPETRHIILDDMGADVWQMCDGETTIDAIRRHLTDKYKLNQKEAEASLLEHLRQLAKRKLIVAIANPAEIEDNEQTPAEQKPNVQRPRKGKKRR